MSIGTAIDRLGIRAVVGHQVGGRPFCFKMLGSRMSLLVTPDLSLSRPSWTSS